MTYPELMQRPAVQADLAKTPDVFVVFDGNDPVLWTADEEEARQTHYVIVAAGRRSLAVPPMPHRERFLRHKMGVR